MPNVLLVEDHPILRDNLRELLEVAHYQVRAVEDGGQALTLLAGFRPDVIVCDILMPHMDGLTFLGVLKQNRTYQSIPLIFLTARSSQAQRIEGLQRGAIDYICKPFSSQELLLKIHNITAQQTDLVRHRIQQSIAQEDLAIDFVRQCTQQLEQLYPSVSLSISQMAQAMSMSQSAFQRNLKRYYQRNFSQLLKEYRLLKAATYLINTDRSIYWIAIRCGFKSLSGFSRCFKEAHHSSPLHYRHDNQHPSETDSGMESA